MRAASLSVSLAAIIAAVTLPRPLDAQAYSRAGVDVGARVRITTRGVPGPDRYAGRVVAVSADSLTLHRDRAAAPSAIAFDAITKLQVSRGRHPNGWRGALTGLVGGAAIGTVIGLVTFKPTRGDCYFFAPCDPDYRAQQGISPSGGAILGATGGLIVGTVVGRFIRSERWVTR